MSDQLTIIDRFAQALERIQSTRPHRIRVPREWTKSSADARTARVRHASVALLLRVQPTLGDEEILAEQYDADGQPIPGTDASKLQQQLCPPPTAAVASSATSASDSGGRGSEGQTNPDLVQAFFSLPWVRRGTPELFFIERPNRDGDSVSSQLAFPGGRREEEDENDLFTALRETWQETGIDLAESKDFAYIGQLDQREITTSLGDRLLMILSPFVFLQTTPFSPHPDLAASEVSSAHWFSLPRLETPPMGSRDTITLDVAHRLAPQSSMVRWFLRTLIGCLDYHCLLLPNDPVAHASDQDVAPFSDLGAQDHSSKSSSQADDLPEIPSLARHHAHNVPTSSSFHSQPPRSLPPSSSQPSSSPVRLWGLTLAMTSDLLSYMPAAADHPKVDVPPPPPPPDQNDMSTLDWITAKANSWFQIHRPRAAWREPPAFAQAAALPHFTYSDNNVFCWFFGWHYRRLMYEWQKTRNMSTSTTYPAPSSSFHTGRLLSKRGKNYSQLVMGAYFLSVRRALLVSVLLRTIGTVSFASGLVWLVLRRLSRRRLGLAGWGLDL